MVIFDTNILIDIYRGDKDVKRKIENLDANVFYVSSITIAEFIVGAKDKADLKRFEKLLGHYTQIPLNAEITEIFLNIFKSYALSHRPGIADALIAATALYYNLPLFTSNKKHFQFIPGLRLI